MDTVRDDVHNTDSIAEVVVPRYVELIAGVILSNGILVIEEWERGSNAGLLMGEESQKEGILTGRDFGGQV